MTATDMLNCIHDNYVTAYIRYTCNNRTMLTTMTVLCFILILIGLPNRREISWTASIHLDVETILFPHMFFCSLLLGYLRYLLGLLDSGYCYQSLINWLYTKCNHKGIKRLHVTVWEQHHELMLLTGWFLSKIYVFLFALEATDTTKWSDAWSQFYFLSSHQVRLYWRYKYEFLHL